MSHVSEALDLLKKAVEAGELRDAHLTLVHNGSAASSFSIGDVIAYEKERAQK
jgi:hypothetical protein